MTSAPSYEKVPLGASDGRDMLAGAGYGLAAFAANMFPVDLAFGLELVLGAPFVYIALHRHGLLAAVIASAGWGFATYLLWNHPYAAIVFTLSLPFLDWLNRQRGYAYSIANSLFWAFIGSWLLWLEYRYLVKMDLAGTHLVVLKQALNSMICVVIAEFTWTIRPPSNFKLENPEGPRQMQRSSIAHFLLVVLVSSATVPVVTAFVLIANSQFRDLQTEATKELKTGTRILERALATFANNAAEITEEHYRDGHGDPEWPLDGSFVLENVYHETADSPRGTIKWIIVKDDSAPAWFRAKDGRFFVHFVDHKLSRQLPADANRTIAIYIEQTSLEAIISGVSDSIGIALFIRTPTLTVGPALPAEYDIPASYAAFPLSGGLNRVAPDDPRLSPMSSWRKSFLKFEEDTRNGPRWTIIAHRPIQTQVDEYRSELSLRIAAMLGFLLVMPFVAAGMRHVILNHMRALTAYIAEMMRDRRATPRRVSHFVEIETIAAEFNAINRALQRQQKIAERERQRLETVIAHAPAIIYAVEIPEAGLRRPARYMNDQVEKLTGYSAAEIAEPGWWKRNLHPEDSARVLALEAQFHRDGHVAAYYRLRHKRGHFIWIYDVLARMPASAEGRGEAIGMWLDQTSQKLSEAALLQAAKLADLGTMATGMAHEINQPLNIIALSAHNAMRKLDPADTDDAYTLGKLERISQQVSRAAKIIDHMRIFGRANTTEKNAFRLAAPVENIAEYFGNQFRLDHIDLQVSHDLGDATVIGQSALVEQVLLNLVNNAKSQIMSRRLTGEGNGAAEVDFVRVSGELSGDGGTAILRVSDSGGGIDPAVKEDIFKPFVTTKPVGQGTGLGLSISYGIIREMGGDIAVDNGERGAIFTIEIPLDHSLAEAANA